MRQQEGHHRATRYAGKVDSELYAPHEFMPSQYPKYLSKMGIMIRLPVVEWSTQDVMDYLQGQQNPLYKKGFGRVGCFPCLASGDKWMETAFNHDAFGAKQRCTVSALERDIGRPVWNSKSGLARNAGPGCAICSM